MAKSDPIRIIRHEAVANCGSFEVRYPGGVEWFYWDNEPSRRLRPGAMTSEEALKKAKALARRKRDGL